MGTACGILGGTFDPVHNAHLSLAECAYKELDLEKVIFIPAYIPPHKQERNITDEYHRIRMLELATDGHEEYEISDIEIQMKGASYTARTLTILKEKYDNMVFILGADSFLALENWYHPEIIFQKAHIACAARNDVELSELELKAHFYEAKYNGVCHILHMPDTPISSTLVREQLSRDIKPDCIPDAVFDYIQNNGLYK
ncbi:MAG: nicotinate (nicotinamide) nucleotide adenylyltransferase [Butyrivibrio sp.]